MGHASVSTSSRRLHCGRFGTAAQIRLNGPFRAFLLWKPTELVGVFPDLKKSFPSKRPPKRNTSSAYSQWRNKVGVRRCSGQAGLKATEHYPAAFCRLVAELLSGNFSSSTCTTCPLCSQRATLAVITRQSSAKLYVQVCVCGKIQRGCTLIQAFSLVHR